MTLNKLWKLLKLMLEALRIIRSEPLPVPPCEPQKPLNEPIDPTEYMGKQSDG